MSVVGKANSSQIKQLPERYNPVSLKTTKLTMKENTRVMKALEFYG